VGEANATIARDGSLGNPSGPVTLLIGNLHKYGAKLSNGLIITIDNEAPIDVINMPWQHVKKAVAEVVINNRSKIASKQRTHLEGLIETDMQIVNKVIAQLGPKEKKIYGHISSGAAWADNHLKDIGESDGKCIHCGEDVDDISHITWKCKVIHKHRKINDLKELNPDVLPCYIKHGVPKAMSTDVQATFWGDKLEIDSPSNEQANNAIGVATCNKSRIVATCKQQEVDDVLSNAGISKQSHNARQAFSKLKANKDPPHLALPYECHRKAPADINVYTDGSWIYPLEQYLGLGGAGVWWPGRNTAVCHRLSPAERELAHSSQYADGLMIYTPIGGYAGSSTRTELAAAILALAANGPVHIGTDSQAFHDRAIRILSNLRKGKKQKGKWQLVSDGDLWQHFEQAASAKGGKAIRISKVKGHVKQAQVDRGLYRQVDKVGNDKADEAADVATSMHGKELVSIADIFHKRHKQYGAFMTKVAKHIIEAYLIHRTLVDKQQASKQSSKATVKFQTVQVQSPANSSKEARSFQLQGAIKGYKAYSNKHKSGNAIWGFVKDLRYREADNQYHATSWLELYLIYRVMGYPKPIADKLRKSRARATIHMQLNEFKNVFRGIVDRAAKDECSKNALKPYKVTHQRFLSLGLAGKHAAISCSIEVDQDVMCTVEWQLIKLGHMISGKQIKQFQDGILQLKPAMPNLKGRAGWDSNIKSIRTATWDKDCNKQAQDNSKRALEPICLQCPSCKASTLSTHAAFQSEDLDRICKCVSCKQSNKSNDWLCSCHVKWHLCNKHNQIAMQICKKPPKCEPIARPKRQVGPLTNEQLQEIDTKRMRKSNGHLIPISANILSAKLRERFAHLL
jgi:hypothetical protein